ncbi:hypothetical protein B0I08_11091 [Glaciihabitans tibetensis]|uniref:Uncharacterized protein n=1 Tax=Glaciihabitans tibetensis TaxID=1266600 RepID=A0A2T0V5J0_9MICO|nr:hypothetical protein [Glaciihabitans tibetensis]PRY65459.1 hypothetical protein B0I08_11091 [Glaciihabitans tibetensis]
MVHQPLEKHEVAERLKERIYVTFTALAVVLALASHGHPTAIRSLATLVVAVIATLLAVFTAELLARMTVNERLLSRDEMRHILGVSVGAIGAITLPAIFLLISALGGWSTDAALRASAFALVAALAVNGYVAVRRARLPAWQRAVALLAEAVLGLAVIGLEILVHR